MSTEKVYHYVYRITNIKERKHYYGVRSCKRLPEEDIGVRYFSSSKDKEFKKDQKSNTSSYKYKVVRVFDDREKAVSLEIKLHKKFSVGSNDSFYNRSCQTALGFDTSGIKLAKGKVSCNKGKLPVKDIKGNTFQVSVDDPRYLSGELVHVRKGIKLSEVAISNISKGHQGRKHNRAIPVNVYDYHTDELIAKDVICREWCKDKIYESNHLSRTLYGDRSRPHCSNSIYKERINPLHHKGIYLKRYTNEL